MEGVNYTAIDAEFQLHATTTMSQAIGGNPGLALNPATHGDWFISILDLEPVPVEYFLGEIEELIEMVVDEMAAGNPSLKTMHIDNFNNALNDYYDRMVPPTPTKMVEPTKVYERAYGLVDYRSELYGDGTSTREACPIPGQLMMGPGCEQRFQGVSTWVPPNIYAPPAGTIPNWSNQMVHSAFVNAPTMTTQCSHKKDIGVQEGGMVNEISVASGQCMDIAGGIVGEISPFSAVSLAVCSGAPPTIHDEKAARCTATCPAGYRILYGTCGDMSCENNDCASYDMGEDRFVEWYARMEQ